MALENLIAVSFTPAELTTLTTAMNTIQTVLAGKVINLTPAQRKQYGSIAEQNKLFVDKAKFYMEQHPEYVPGFLSKAEFDKDYLARTQIAGPAARLAELAEQLADTKIMLDHDNLFNARTFYRNIKYLAGENAPGITSIYEEMKQFFIFNDGPEEVKPASEEAEGSSEAPKE